MKINELLNEELTIMTAGQTEDFISKCSKKLNKELFKDAEIDVHGGVIFKGHAEIFNCMVVKGELGIPLVFSHTLTVDGANNLVSFNNFPTHLTDGSSDDVVLNFKNGTYPKLTSLKGLSLSALGQLDFSACSKLSFSEAPRYIKYASGIIVSPHFTGSVLDFYFITGLKSVRTLNTADEKLQEALNALNTAIDKRLTLAQLKGLLTRAELTDYI